MSQTWQNNRVVPVTVMRMNEDSALDTIEPGDVFRFTSKSKGKGFQGVVKRHGFGGGPKSHGQKHRLRAPGSIGATAPQRTWKGRKMAGRMGYRQVTIRLPIVAVESATRKLLVKGALPGRRGTQVNMRKVLS